MQGLKSLLQKLDKPPRDVVAIELLRAELRCRGSEAASAIQPLIGALDLCHKHHLGHQAALCELQLAFVQVPVLYVSIDCYSLIYTVRSGLAVQSIVLAKQV